MSENWNGQQVNMATADEEVREFYIWKTGGSPIYFDNVTVFTRFDVCTNSSASISSTSSVHVSQKDANSNNNSKSKVLVSSSSSATSSSVEWSERGAGNSEVDLHSRRRSKQRR